jgi:hypothetical protein
MGEQAERARVIDNGTGVYFWHGSDKQRVGDDWVFMALFRCEQCGRAVTIVRFDRSSVDEPRFRRMRVCPGGCSAVHEWLAPADHGLG